MKTDQASASNIKQFFPWVLLFRTFSLAFDTSKLLLAALGILATALGWWVLSLIFGFGYEDAPPQWVKSHYEKSANPWGEFKRDRESWNLMHQAARIGVGAQTVEIEDIAESEAEFQSIKESQLTREDLTGPKAKALEEKGWTKNKLARAHSLLGKVKPSGELTTWPWFEERGPNPYLLATGQSGIPWQAGRFLDWVIIQQSPVLIEPLVKVLRPMLFVLHPEATFTQRIYFLLTLVWVLGVWSYFGGAIARIVVVQIARNENIGAAGGLRFAKNNFSNLVCAPLFCPIIALFLLVVIMFFSLFGMIPIVGDILVSGLFWGVFVILGLVMALVLVGIFAWPMMVATVSSEGLDSWESFSRGIQYMYTRAWSYISYNLLAIGYGIVAVFFIGFMSSFGVYLAKWSAANTPFIQSSNRSPEYLFVFAPTSFGWRELLLQGVKVDGENLVVGGKVDAKVYQKYLGLSPESFSEKDSLRWWNLAGAGLTALWLGGLFLLVIGFGYSFFWTAFTLIFLLLRKDLDNNEINELHLEEEEEESQYSPVLEQPQAAPGPATRSLPLIDPSVGAPPEEKKD
ncbi:MAG: hypothetical protein EXR99_15435 [Gemmataceae bacterium]|nr:hypothetical protein [Gemmataceae bacterium]